MNGHGGVDAAEAVDGGGHQALGGAVGLARSRTPSTDLDRGAGVGQLVDQPVGRVADDEVVAPLGQQPGQRRSDVAGGVGHERHPSSRPSAHRRPT